MVHFVILDMSTCLKLFKYTFKPKRTEFFAVCLQFVSCLFTYIFRQPTLEFTRDDYHVMLPSYGGNFQICMSFSLKK